MTSKSSLITLNDIIVFFGHIKQRNNIKKTVWFLGKRNRLAVQTMGTWYHWQGKHHTHWGRHSGCVFHVFMLIIKETTNYNRLIRRGKNKIFIRFFNIWMMMISQSTFQSQLLKIIKKYNLNTCIYNITWNLATQFILQIHETDCTIAMVVAAKTNFLSGLKLQVMVCVLSFKLHLGLALVKSLGLFRCTRYVWKTSHGHAFTTNLPHIDN